MRVISATAEILSPTLSNQDEIDDMFQRMEFAGRTCYKSTNRITPISARKFVENLVKSGHEAMIEHAGMTVLFTVDRGVSHELVRHRVASFAQESTRYCNYSKDKFGNELTFIKPCFWDDKDHEPEMKAWTLMMNEAEQLYMALQQYNAPPEEIRCILPNSLKTEVVMTANFREWRHFFKLRVACETGMPHPQMLEVTVPLYQKCVAEMPELFSDTTIPADVIAKYGGDTD